MRKPRVRNNEVSFEGNSLIVGAASCKAAIAVDITKLSSGILDTLTAAFAAELEDRERRNEMESRHFEYCGVVWERGPETGGVWQGRITDPEEFSCWVDDTQDWQEIMLDEMSGEQII